MIRAIVFLLLTLPFLLMGQGFDMNDRCRQAYHEIMKLRFESGRTLLEKEKKENAGNRIPYLVENYIDFLSVYISEDKVLFELADDRREVRMNMLKSGDKRSPYYLYSMAELSLQGAFSRIKFGDYLKAILEVKKAYSLLKENDSKFPEFTPNDKSLALLMTLFGAIPDQYKLGAKILGLKGDINEGIKMMQALTKDKHFLFRDETLILFTMLQLHLQKNEQGAWQMVEQAGLPLGDNLLNHFVAASVALHTGKNDRAIQILSTRPTGSDYFPFPYLDAMLGQAKLNRLDKDASGYIHKFLDKFRGMTYIKDAYRRLAWYWLVNGQPDQYIRYMKVTLGKGTTIVDEDKSSQKEAQNNEIPNACLLKARLLFDGAYYPRALEVLSTCGYDKLTPKEKAEYLYRKGRILHESGNTEEAVKYYLNAIKATGSQPWYYAPNACIKLGNIYEKTGDKTKAGQYYTKALSYDDHEYQNSTDAEAKAGLNRID